MVIDKTTGSVLIGKERIYPGLSEESFSKLLLAQDAKRSLQGEGWISYTGLLDERIAAILYFKNNLIMGVTLGLKSEGYSSWNDWSEEKEIDQQRKHEQLLLDDLGNPPYHFTWGKVVAVLDKKTGSSSIVVRYSA